MVVVVNKYKVPNHVYCGRGSALGNPFPMKTEADRNKVCDQYEKYFYEEVFVKGNEAMLKQLKMIIAQARIGDVNLGCFCSPKRCHCDTIKRYVDERV